MASDNLVSSFNGGEQIETLEWRLDQDRARNACRRLQNFQPLVPGGVIQRPGTLMHEALAVDAKPFKIVGFNFNTEQSEARKIDDDIWRRADGYEFDVTRTVGFQDLPWGNSATPLKLPVWTYSPGALPSGHLDDALAERIREVQSSQQDDIIRLTHARREPMEHYRDYDGSWKTRTLPQRYFPLAPYEYTQDANAAPVTVKTVITVAGPIAATATYTPTSGGFMHEVARLTASLNGFTGSLTLKKASAPSGAVPASGAFTTTLATQSFTLKTGEVFLTADVLCEAPLRGEEEGGLGATDLVSWVRVELVRSAGSASTITLVERQLPDRRGEDTTLTCLDTTPVTPYNRASYSGPTPRPAFPGVIRVRANARLFTSLHASMGGRLSFADFDPGAAIQGSDGGAYLRIEHQRPDARIVLGLSASGTSAPLQVQGDCNVLTLGTWHGTIYIESQKPKTAEWETETSIFRNGQSNASQSVSVDGVRYVRLRFVDAVGTPSGTPQAILTPLNNKAFGLLRVWRVVDGFFAYCHVVDGQNPFSTAPTTYWQEGAWSRARGYPVTSGVYQQRVWMAGTDAEPFTVWFSELNEPMNWHQGISKDTDPLQLTPSAERRHRILWGHATAQGLLIGTTGSEWLITPSTAGAALTPTNRQALLQSEFGSANVKAVRADDVVMFAQRGGFAIRESSFADEINKQAAVSLSVLAEHALRPCVVAMDYAAQPIGSLWCVMANGTVAVMTYERQQGVVAWWRLQTQGLVDSVAVTYGADGQADQVWLATRRNGRRYIERLTPTWWRDLHDRAVDLSYLDCKTSNNVSPFPDFAALTTWACHKTTGEVRGPYTGRPTEAQVPRTADWWVGLGYEALLMPMRTEFQTQSGTMQGKRMRVSQIAPMLWNSGTTGQYRSSGTGSGGDGGGWHALPVARIDPPGQTGPLYSGIIPQVHVPARHGFGVDWEIRNASPTPLNLLAVVPTWEAYG